MECELNIIYSYHRKGNLESEQVILEGSWGLILLLDHKLVDLQFCCAWSKARIDEAWGQKNWDVLEKLNREATMLKIISNMFLLSAVLLNRRSGMEYVKLGSLILYHINLSFLRKVWDYNYPTQLPEQVLFSIFPEIGRKNGVIFTAYSLVECMPFLPGTSC